MQQKERLERGRERRGRERNREMTIIRERERRGEF